MKKEDGEYVDEVFEEETKMLPKEAKRKIRKQMMKDTLQWGQGEEKLGRWYEEVLSEGDEDLVDALEDLCGQVQMNCKDETKVMGEVEVVQAEITEWFPTLSRKQGKGPDMKGAAKTRKPLIQRTLFDWKPKPAKNPNNLSFKENRQKEKGDPF